MRPRELSNTSSTEARLTAFLSMEPLKMTSCMCSPRSCLAEDSPRPQRTASITLDLPQPLGPTTPTSWPGTAIEVGSTNDLNPESLTERRRKGRFTRCFGRIRDFTGTPSPIPMPQSRRGLETFPHPARGRDYAIHMQVPEFT